MNEELIQGAVDTFWEVRTRQAARLADGGAAGGAARAAGHLRGFEALLSNLLADAGIEPEDLTVGRAPLPGYFRHAKNWDLAAMHQGSLAAAIEFKSQVGSVGKNLNNRLEEALGNSLDITSAHAQKSTYGPMGPWLGYVMVVSEDNEMTRTPRLNKTLLATGEEFHGASYLDRYRLMIERMLKENLYQAGWLIATAYNDGHPTWRQPSKTATHAFFEQRLRLRVDEVKAAVESYD